MNDLDELKQKYQEGYRCIYSEKDDKEGVTMHLKNFREEKIHTMNVKSDMEIGKIDDFLDQVSKLKKQKGYDW